MSGARLLKGTSSSEPVAGLGRVAGVGMPPACQSYGAFGEVFSFGARFEKAWAILLSTFARVLCCHAREPVARGTLVRLRPDVAKCGGSCCFQGVCAVSDWNGAREKHTFITSFTKVSLANPDLQVGDRKSTRLNSSHIPLSRMPSSA